MKKRSSVKITSGSNVFSSFHILKEIVLENTGAPRKISGDDDTLWGIDNVNALAKPQNSPSVRQLVTDWRWKVHEPPWALPKDNEGWHSWACFRANARGLYRFSLAPVLSEIYQSVLDCVVHSKLELMPRACTIVRQYVDAFIYFCFWRFWCAWMIWFCKAVGSWVVVYNKE